MALSLPGLTLLALRLQEWPCRLPRVPPRATPPASIRVSAAPRLAEGSMDLRSSCRFQCPLCPRPRLSERTNRPRLYSQQRVSAKRSRAGRRRKRGLQRVHRTFPALAILAIRGGVRLSAQSIAAAAFSALPPTGLPPLALTNPVHLP